MRIGIMVAIDKILGGTPKDEEVFSTYNEAKRDELAERVNKDAAMTADQEQAKRLRELAELDSKGQTGFLQDDTGLFLRDYQVLGFFKAAGDVRRKCYEEGVEEEGSSSSPKKKGKGTKWGSIGSKVRQFMLVEPMKIYFKWNDEEIIKAPTSILERTLRVETLQGPRVALAKSELIDAGDDKVITCKFVVDVLDNSPINKSMIEEMLGYGQRVGLLQWRTAGYGRFEWREIPVESVTTPAKRDVWSFVKPL